MDVDISSSELDHLLDVMIKLRRGMCAGDLATYVREIEKRGIPRSTIQFVIGLVAISGGAPSFDGMEFEFNDQLEIKIADSTRQFSLSELVAYDVVARRSGALEADWLNAIVRAYSSEYAELIARLEKGIVGEIQLRNPVIRIDAA